MNTTLTATEQLEQAKQAELRDEQQREWATPFDPEVSERFKTKIDRERETRQILQKQEVQTQRQPYRLPDSRGPAGDPGHQGPLGSTGEEPINLSLVILTKTRQILQNRRTSYGGACDSFKQIAALWSVYLGVSVSKKDVAMMMTLLKVSREQAKHDVDNLVDICGYAALTNEVLNGG